MSGPSMPGALAGGRQPGAVRSSAAFGPLVRLVARGLLGRRRSLAVAVLAASPILVGAILAVAGSLGNPATLALEVFGGITLGLVIPLVSLVLGTAALGTAIDDGTIVYLLVKPVPRRTLAGSALLVAAVAAAALNAPGVFVSGILVAGPGEIALVGATLVGGLVAAVLYAAVFVALSAWTSRALVIGLAYVLVWEGLITSLFEGTRALSIREYALAIVNALAGDASRVDTVGGVDATLAVVLAAVVLAGAFGVAAWRLGRFEVSEPG